MTAYGSAPITDPDQMGYDISNTDIATDWTNVTEEIVIDPQNLRIALKVIGNLTEDGATVKAVYSSLKDAWRVDTDLIKYPFPMGPITDEQFELVNGWNWDNTETSGATQTTTELLRTGGWSVVNLSGGITEMWTSVVTLGSLGSTDQVYYQQTDADTASVDFILTGPVNQAVQIWRDDNGDGSADEDYTTYFKCFVREWEKLYAVSAIADIGVTTLTYQAYRFPLTNSADLKIQVATANIATDLDADANGYPDVGVYANVDVQYLRDSGNNVYSVVTANNGVWANNTAYVIGNVLQDEGDSRWYKVLVDHTSDSADGDPSANATLYEAYEGEREIGTGVYYPFTVIIDGDIDVGPTADGAASKEEIYTAVQYMLSFPIDIDFGANGVVTGKTADALLSFVGDTLVTAAGVYIDSFAITDTNSITFTPSVGTAVQFPFVASLIVNFGTNLQNDDDSKYWIFFTSANGNDYGSDNAIIVNDADSAPMTGSANVVSVTHSFNYDSNVQGGRTQQTVANVTAVGIGLETGQFVSATGSIGRSVTNSVTLTASLERNYSAGTV